MKWRRVWVAVVLAAALVWANNSSWLASPPAGGPKLLAHRGLGQTFSLEGVTGDTDTSKRIFPPEHRFLENTVPGIEAAFGYGADVVELDIHPTTDGQFAVFHDWTLDYRTEGKGVTRDSPLIPERVAPWLWGWPDRFQRRMEAAGTRVVLVAGDAKWSAGFDSEADLARVPPGFAGWVWTNRVDRVGPVITGKSALAASR